MNENILAYFLAYFIASIPFGAVIAKTFYKINLRKVGSGSIGATNVLRAIKKVDPKNAKKFAILTVVCDVLKGLIPILIATKFMNCDINVLWTMAVMAVMGHCFSVFLGFDGGKGVATSYGVFVMFLPLEALISVIVWFLVGKFGKVSSLASLSSLAVFLILSFIIHPNMPGINTHAPIIIIIFIVFYKHIPNIKRLILREEAKVI